MSPTKTSGFFLFFFVINLKACLCSHLSSEVSVPAHSDLFLTTFHLQLSRLYSHTPVALPYAALYGALQMYSQHLNFLTFCEATATKFKVFRSFVRVRQTPSSGSF